MLSMHILSFVCLHIIQNNKGLYVNGALQQKPISLTGFLHCVYHE